MAGKPTRQPPTASLRLKILLVTLAGFALVAVPAYWAFTTLVSSTVVQLGTLFAEKQILFDRYRGLGALKQEVALAETLTRSPIMRDWALDETNPAKRAQAIAELELYRDSFANHAYFFVVNGSGNYYYNDETNSYAGKQLSHTLRRDNPRDGWYYETAALGSGCHLNVDHDDALAVTNVWINCVIREGERVLGVLGTGLNLTEFIRDVVEFPQAGVQTMFVDRSGALQAHRDPRFIDFHSLTNAIESKKTIYSLLDSAGDRSALQQMMDEVTAGDIEVRSRFMQVDGHQVLVGIGYLDGLGWYNVSFMDIDKIIDRSLFLPIGLLIAALMLAVALAIVLLFKIAVLDRLAKVEKGVVAVKEGERQPVVPDRGNDEIGRLSRSLSTMADVVQDNMRTLEHLVEERTAELQALAYRDQLTGIGNRRGFSARFAEIQAAASKEARLALLLIDVDNFKEINDGFGHQAGDEVVTELARRIAAVLRTSDACGRWGGDEFIVLFSDLGTRSLKFIAEAMRRGLSNPVALKDGRSVPVTVSIGACLVEPNETVEQVADMADAALYAAKETGRNVVVVYDPTRSRTATA
ncbi:MAG: diguanylate cyclase [Hyphomicrobiales bacterium]|nr:MAG: diguanylate cyclase [Hyphomicrobiales bacterium]